MGNDDNVEGSDPGRGEKAKNDDNMDTAGPDMQSEAGGDDRMDVVNCDGDKSGGEGNWGCLEANCVRKGSRVAYVSASPGKCKKRAFFLR